MSDDEDSTDPDTAETREQPSDEKEAQSALDQPPDSGTLEEMAADVFEREETQRQIKYIVSLFAVFGIGVGIAFSVPLLLADTTSQGPLNANVLFIGFTSAAFSMPLLSILSGILTGMHLDGSGYAVGLTAGTGVTLGSSVVIGLNVGVGIVFGNEGFDLDIGSQFPRWLWFVLCLGAMGYGAAYVTNAYLDG